MRLNEFNSLSDLHLVLTSILDHNLWKIELVKSFKSQDAHKERLSKIIISSLTFDLKQIDVYTVEIEETDRHKAIRYVYHRLTGKTKYPDDIDDKFPEGCKTKIIKNQEGRTTVKGLFGFDTMAQQVLK